MGEDNPFAGLVIEDEPERRKRRPVGPLMAGLIAAVLATYFEGSTGAIAAVVAVGSWWVYKFWPRPPAPIAPEAQAFVDHLEGVRPDEIDAVPGTKPGAGGGIEEIRL